MVGRPFAALYAWLAGAAFAASLAYFVYFYFVWLGRPVADAPGRVFALAIDAALFGAFAAHHSLMARTRAKRWLARWVPAHLERATYVWLASGLFFATCAAWRDVPGTLYALAGPAAAPGWLAEAAGLWLIARSTSALDPLELAGIRQARTADRRLAPGGHDAVPPQPLQVTGPYRLVRHPLYLGWMLMVFGAPQMTANRFTFACVSTAYLILAIPWEERSLEEAYGAAYRQYTTRVRWRLIPGLY